MKPEAILCLTLVIRFFSIAITSGFCFCASRVAATPTDYLVDVWNTENGLPSSTVASIAQTPDGYLWIGTYNGLARFDGARFVFFDPVSTPELSQARIQGLFLDVNGTLWVNTFRGGLTSYRDGVFHRELPDQDINGSHTTLVLSSSNLITFVTQHGQVLQRDPVKPNSEWKIYTPPTSSRSIIFQCTDSEGQLWFLTHDGQILQFTAGGFERLPNDGGLPGGRINALVADEHGKVWAGAENEIACWNGNQFQVMTPTNGEANIQPRLLFPTKAGDMWVLDGERFRKMSGRTWTTEIPQWRGLLGSASGRAMGVHEDRDGGLWFNHYGNGLFHITPDGEFQRLTTQDGLPGENRIDAWFQSNDGGIWAGVDRGGLARLRDRRFHVVSTGDGLPTSTALSVCENKNGAILIGTAGGGLCQWSNGAVTNYAVSGSAAANFIFSISPRADGGAWLSAAEGEDLYRFFDGHIQHGPQDVHGIKSIFTDSRGRVWLGTKYGVVFLSENWRRIAGTNGIPTLSTVRALVETTDGNVWAGADDGTIYHCEPDKLTPFRPNGALAEQPIYSMAADSDGTIWAGTFHGGLLRFKNGKFSRITAKQGLPVGVISQILDDGKRLWLGTHQGIYCVEKSALNDCADGRADTLNYVAYGRHDGMASAECSDGYQPACWRASDGKLWFTTVRGGAVWVNPDELTTKSLPPPVIIEELHMDGEPVSLRGGKVVVPPGHKQLDFRFTALNFDAGENVRFRYRVDGQDTDWADVDTRRTVSLRNLLPRDYRFHVIACNNEGVWNENGAAVEFEVEPFFYQTLPFKIILGGLVAGGIFFAARRATTHKYRRKLALLQQQHAIERDRARIAKDIHDDIGAGLTHITLLTEFAAREPEQIKVNLARITDFARTLTRAMDEIVWAVNPRHDTLNGLMDYISAYTEGFLRMAGIRCRMDLPATLPDMRVNAELRYNLFLALKEALNNIVKHAEATEVWLRLRIEPKFLTLSVEDNGRGLSAASSKGAQDANAGRISSGSGLANMKKRLTEIGGRCEIRSEDGKGTRVEMSVVTNPVGSEGMTIGGDNRA